jgi:hypothetical protein
MREQTSASTNPTGTGTSAERYSFTVCNPTFTSKYHAKRHHAQNLHYCGVLTVDNISGDRLLDDSMLYFLINCKTQKWQSHSPMLYEVFLPALAGHCSNGIFSNLECASAADTEPDDWIKADDVVGMDGESAEWRSFLMAFRFLLRKRTQHVVRRVEEEGEQGGSLGGAGGSDVLMLEICTGYLQASVADMEDMRRRGLQLSLGDRAMLEAAARHTAEKCVAVCAANSGTIIPVVQRAHSVVEEVMASSWRFGHPPHLDREHILPLQDDGGGTSCPSSVPVSDCLFPRWELVEDSAPNIPAELLGGVSTTETANIEKMEKIGKGHVDMHIAPMKSHHDQDAVDSLESLYVTVDKLNDVVSKLLSRHRDGFPSALHLLIAVVEDGFTRLIELPDRWNTELWTVRLFKLVTILENLLNMGRLYMGAKLYSEAEEIEKSFRLGFENRLEFGVCNLLANANEASRVITMASLQAITNGVLSLPVSDLDKDAAFVFEAFRSGRGMFLAPASWDGVGFADRMAELQIRDPHLALCRDRLISYFASQQNQCAVRLLSCDGVATDPASGVMRSGYGNAPLSGSVGLARPLGVFKLYHFPKAEERQHPEPLLEFTLDVLRKMNKLNSGRSRTAKIQQSELPDDYEEILAFEKVRSKESETTDESGGGGGEAQSGEGKEGSDKKGSYMPASLNELAAWWLCSKWESHKSFAYIRDIHALCKVAFEPTVSLLLWFEFLKPDMLVDFHSLDRGKFETVLVSLKSNIAHAFLLRYSVKMDTKSAEVSGGSSNGSDGDGVGSDSMAFVMKVERRHGEESPTKLALFKGVVLSTCSLYEKACVNGGLQRALGVMTDLRKDLESKLVETTFAPGDRTVGKIHLREYGLERPDRIDEVDVLYAKLNASLSLSPPDVTCDVSAADVETLLCFATVPAVSMPLVLEFLENEKLKMLTSPEVRGVLDTMFYAVGPYETDDAAAAAGRGVDTQPAIPFKEPMGTRHGVLFDTVSRDPLPVLGAALRLTISAAKTCSKVHCKHNLVDVMLYIAQLNCTLVDFSVVASRKVWVRHPSRNEWNALLDQLIKSTSELVLSLLRKWITEAEHANSGQGIVVFATHIALCEATTLSRLDEEDGLQSGTAMMPFLMCSCYAMEWCRKVGGGTLDPFKVPFSRLMSCLQKHRHRILTFCGDPKHALFRSKMLEGVTMFTLQRKSFSAALNMYAEASLWKSVSSDVFFTEKIVDSEHPYPYDMRSVDKVEICDAPYILLQFFEESTLGHRPEAKLTIFSDRALSVKVKEIRPDDTWPGSGSEPVLVIKGSCAYLVLESPPPAMGTIASQREDYGYKLSVKAPVSDAKAVALLQVLKEESRLGGSVIPFTLKMCRSALQACYNDLSEAKTYIKNHFKMLKNPSGSGGNNKPLDDDKSSLLTVVNQHEGYFEREGGQCSIQLNTFEILEAISARQDLPANLWNRFYQVLAVASGNVPPLCTVLKDTPTIRDFKAVCPRKSDPVTYLFRLWKQPEECPSRDNYFTRRSAETFQRFYDDSETSSVFSRRTLGSEFCDYGLHGLEGNTVICSIFVNI